MRVEKKSLSDVLTFLNQLDPAVNPKPVHIKNIAFDSTTGHYVITYLPSGLSYPALPSRTKANILDDAAPIVGTPGIILTEYNQCRLYIEVLDVGGLAIPAGNATITLWHRTRKGDEDAPAAPAVGTWLKGPTVFDINTDQEVIDVMLYHREVYAQLTDIAGAGAVSVTVYITGIEDSDFQQPLSFTPGGALEAHLTGVNIEGANLEVQIEASPDDPGEEADSVILASTLDETLPTDPGNLAPPVMPVRIDYKGRYVVEGTAAIGALAPSTFPQVIAGHHTVGGVYASLTTALVGANNDLIWAAVQPGAVGNAISVAYVDGGGGSALTIGVAGAAITVTGDIGAGVTPDQIKAVAVTDARVWSLVHAEDAVGNDGTGNIIAMAAVNLAGGAGVTRIAALALGAGGGMEVVVEAIPDTPGEKADSIVDCSTIDHTVPSNANLAPPVASLHIDALGRQTAIGYVPDHGIEEGAFPIKTAGVDYGGTYAQHTTALGVLNAELVYTALKVGVEGNGFSIEYIDGGGGSALIVGWAAGALSVTCDIGAGVTAQAVLDAVNADIYVRLEVRVDLAAGNDGTGNIAVYGPLAFAGGLNRRYVNIPKVIGDGTAIVGGTSNSGNDHYLPIGEEDAASTDMGVMISGRAYFGLPAPVPGDAREKPFLLDPWGRNRVIVDNYRSEINDSIRNRPIIPEQIVDGGVSTTSATPGNTTVLTLISNPLKYGVWLRVSPKFGVNALLGAFNTSGNNTIIDAAGDPVAGFMFWRDDPGLLFIPVNCPSKIYVSSDRASVPIVYVGI